MNLLAFDKPLGRAIRWPLRFMPTNKPFPFLLGPNRGIYWIVGSATHGCWIGWYEWELAHKIRAACRPGMIAFDVGANVGYYTLLMSRAIGPSGLVYAFEP